MRAARSTASWRLAGWPSTRATGRSSTWWLRNHALPSTQAFLALVMRWPSTVNSMSSQTQPQKVQVALLTIFSSVAEAVIGWVSLGSTPGGRRNVQLLADLFCEAVVDLAVARYGRASSVGGVLHPRVLGSFSL